MINVKKQPEKKFNIPTGANGTGEIGMQNTVKSNQPFDAEDRLSGDSVDEHKKIESFNESQAEKEIGQAFNNS
ncbi:hypothetical protein SAMN05421743_103241 [Thalassobacillus cyri]|uniref:Uncharacterized protein n=1 Tax=Thalassobacillus cyri TaxID=571932 RepID=A0A1H3ZH38_9BACI|nr:hypothetical protein SAMN05421743_103241 [Thalassobacillus cyri]